MRSRLEDLNIARSGVTASLMIDNHHQGNSVSEQKISEMIENKLLLLKQITQSNSKGLQDLSQLSGENGNDISQVHSVTNRNERTIKDLQSSVSNMKLSITNLTSVTNQNGLNVKNLTAKTFEFNKEIDEVEEKSQTSLSEINNLKAQVTEMIGTKSAVSDCCIINRNSLTNLTAGYLNLKNRFELQNIAVYHFNVSLHKITDVLKSNHRITNDLITVSLANQEKIEYLMNKTDANVSTHIFNETFSDPQSVFEVSKLCFESQKRLIKCLLYKSTKASLVTLLLIKILKRSKQVF